MDELQRAFGWLGEHMPMVNHKFIGEKVPMALAKPSSNGQSDDLKDRFIAAFEAWERCDAQDKEREQELYQERTRLERKLVKNGLNPDEVLREVRA